MTSGRGQLTHNERLDWLRLARTENIGGAIFDQLLRRYQSAAAALDALPSLVKRGNAPVIPPLAAVERELDQIERHGAHLIAACEAAYPPLLRQIDSAPPVLTVIGRPELLSQPSVAIVGSRNASLNGQRFAAGIAADLGKAGMVIVSGLARGIDGKAHEASLATGTIAVLAGGADVIYPLQHRALYQQMAEAGAIVSERPWGAEPMGKMFPRRNRIISGLSLGVVVVEAARRSGTLITAQRALEQNREIFAVPGFPADPRSSGTNQLIREGAVLTETADDVLEVIRPLLSLPPERRIEPRAAAEKITDLFSASARDEETSEIIDISEEAEAPSEPAEIILSALGSAPTAVDELIRNCNLSAQTVTTILTELELEGRISRLPGNRVARLSG
jgi:DNA processing protein